MKLFLCSSFITKETRSDFESLIGRSTRGYKLACITTASKGYIKTCESKGEKPDLSWIEDELKIAKDIFGFDSLLDQNKEQTK